MEKTDMQGDTVSVISATYDLQTPANVPADPTCAQNFDHIVSHLEYLVAQKNGGQAAVSP